MDPVGGARAFEVGKAVGAVAAGARFSGLVAVVVGVAAMGTLELVSAANEA
jgi:hypothetical protein